MTSKKELIDMLNAALDLEEHIFVVEYEKYLDFIEDEGVGELLNRLIHDSRQHALVLGEMIAEVEESGDEEW